MRRRTKRECLVKMLKYVVGNSEEFIAVITIIGALILSLLGLNGDVTQKKREA